MKEYEGDIFKALADKSRRALLDRLFEQDGLTLGELCDEMRMSRQAVSKHLAILEAANLITCLMKGRNKHHYLNPVPLQQIADRWIGKFKADQARALTNLKNRLEE